MLPIDVYPLNRWYVAAFSGDVVTAPLARTICGRSVALFRTQSGKVAAVEDRCIHRGMPLTHGGECQGEIIRCPYHGLEFDGTGACVKIPGQDRVPPTARIRRFPVVEKNRVLWIWMGEEERADESLVPSHRFHDDPEWAWSPIVLEIACDWQLLNDNLLDLTHVGFVHQRTIGGEPEEHTAGALVETEREGEVVRVQRRLPNSTPPPLYAAVHAFNGKIDRWQEIEFSPGLITIWSGGIDAGTGAYEGRRVGGVQMMGFHGVTPSSTARCYYHFTVSRNYQVDSDAIHKKVHEGTLMTLLEDKDVLEAQQARSLEEPDRGFVDIRSDAGALQARRIIHELVEAERSGKAVGAASEVQRRARAV